MSQVYIVYEMEEEDTGGRYQPSLYIKQVIGVYADKDKAIADVRWMVKGLPEIEISDRFVNGVEQAFMYWTVKGWRDRILYKLETRTLIDWE